MMQQKEFILKNKCGMSVEVLSTGAAIRQVFAPDARRTFQNVALGFAAKKDYRDNPLFAGAALGPVAGRISGASLCVSGKTYALTKNDGANHLHGGVHNVSFCEWEVEQADGNRLCLHTFLADGTDGYPGNRDFYATYTLDDENRLTLAYSATSDQDTYFNPSNHTYWNLSGDFSRDALTQTLTLHSSRCIENDSSHLPAALRLVDDTPFDFRKPHTPRSYVNANPALLSYGYNNGYALDAGIDWAKTPAATLEDAESGRRMDIFTDAPCLVFYSGGYIPDHLELLSGIRSFAGCALALEAQDFPDALNCPLFHGTVTKAGETYRRVIQFCFDTVPND